MLSKNKRSYDPQSLNPRQKLRRNVQDLLANNALSCDRLVEISTDVHDVDAACFADVARLQKKQKRDVITKFLKGASWYPVYWAKIRCWNPAKTCEEERWLAIHLPHEIIATLLRFAVGGRIKEREGMDAISLAHLRAVEELLGEDLLGIGLWADGTPCNWDRTESVETLAMNLPGLTGDLAALRFVVTALGKKHVSSNTWADIHRVIKWSLQVLISGEWPTTRHDGSAWRKSDAKRSVPAKLIKSVLVEARADWDWMRKVFGFPAHNKADGNCWKCKCTPETVMGLTFPRMPIALCIPTRSTLHLPYDASTPSEESWYSHVTPSEESWYSQVCLPCATHAPTGQRRQNLRAAVAC